MQAARIEQQIEIPISWSELPMGVWVAEEIQEFLNDWCPNFFGSHLLKVGALSAQLSCQRSAIRHQIALAPQGKGIDLYGDPHQLPVRTGTIDLCLLAHCLDFSADPHQILREAERVLTDDGWIIISGYNPISVIGFGQCLPKWRTSPPWSGRMFMPNRVIDWLHLLGCEVIFDERFGFPLFGKISWWSESIGRYYGRPFASVYLIVARKQRFPLLPVRRRWQFVKPMPIPKMARQGM